MSFGAEFFDFLPWGWLESFFGWDQKEEKPIRFSPDVQEFLTATIKFEDRQGTALYLLVKRIELLETPLDQQYTFDFEISLDPPPPDYSPRFGKWQPAELEATVFRYGQQAASTTLYGYTFSSLNSLEQNKENLREFVMTQRVQCNEDELKYKTHCGNTS